LHRGRRETPETHFITVMFEPNLFSCSVPAVSNFINGLLEKHIRLTTITKDPEIIDLFLRLHHMQDEKGDVATLKITAMVYELLALLRERCLVDMQVQFSAKNTFSEIINYIQENYNQPLSSSFLCKKFGYSQNYFSRRFIAETGMPPTAFIRTVRLENAAEMLRETDMSISSIALACGFTTTKYFTHCFRELYNITPGQFRNANQE
jgi:AraC-like DNA-binding protein